MSLTDIVSHADLALFPQVAMVLFLLVFVAVLVRVGRRSGSEAETWRRAARLPLEDGATDGPITQEAAR